MNLTQFTIGTDPEVFLFNTITKKYVPASRYFEDYGKSNPLDLGFGYKVLKDNVMLEWNQPPADSLDDFINNTYQAINLIAQEINDASIEFKFESSVHLKDFEFVDESSKEFGCEPAYNIYDMENSPKENDKHRYGAGHIHIGFDKLNTDDKLERFIRCLDYNLYVPMLNIEGETRRNKYYGAPGNFRKTPYGIEYRSLSNFWLKDEELISFVYNGVQKSIEMFEEGVFISKEQVFQSINLKEQV